MSDNPNGPDGTDLATETVADLTTGAEPAGGRPKKTPTAGCDDQDWSAWCSYGRSACCWVE
ncbi:MAG: hypothetical protein L0I76_13090 [Pseudonocardia sp.]|nr:hypothetical protein [Pseudonocardia sp.]